MSLAGGIIKYTGGELAKSAGKGIVKAGAQSALNSLVPEIATKAVTKAGTGLATNTLSDLVSNLPKATLEYAPGGMSQDTYQYLLSAGKAREDLYNKLGQNISDADKALGGWWNWNKNGRTTNFSDIDRNLSKELIRQQGDKPVYRVEVRQTPRFGEKVDYNSRVGDNVSFTSDIRSIRNYLESLNDKNNVYSAQLYKSMATPENTVITPEVFGSSNSMLEYVLNTPKSLEPISTRYPAIEGNYGEMLDALERDMMEDLKNSGAEKYLGKPKIQSSPAEEPYITLYHGTPNKFEDFDESLPSVWFSDSDKNLRDTGLSIKGGQPMNIMERQLPKDLKIADEDLADRLTKSQLQDRGYAGIAYTERGPNGDETYYEIFNPNQTLNKIPKVSDDLMSPRGSNLLNEYDDLAQVSTYDILNSLGENAMELSGVKPSEFRNKMLDLISDTGIDRTVRKELLARSPLAVRIWSNEGALNKVLNGLETEIPKSQALMLGYKIPDLATEYAEGILYNNKTGNFSISGANLDEIEKTAGKGLLEGGTRMSSGDAYTPSGQNVTKEDWRKYIDENNFKIKGFDRKELSDGVWKSMQDEMFEDGRPGQLTNAYDEIYTQMSKPKILNGSIEQYPTGNYEEMGNSYLDKLLDMSGEKGGKSRLSKMMLSEIELSPQQQEFFKDSVIRDAEGNLMPMYHGTNNDFTVFDINKSGKSNTIAPVGFWFTPNEQGAKKFASSTWYGDNPEAKAMKVYLNIKNPKVYESVNNTSKINELTKEMELYKKQAEEALDKMVGEGRYSELYKNKRNEYSVLSKKARDIENQIEDLAYEDAYEQFRSDVYAMEGKSPREANIAGMGSGLSNSLETIPKFVERLKSEGYDGIIIKGTRYDSDTLGGKNDQYIAFDPEQIKNVDNLNPTNNPDIRMSKNEPSLVEMAKKLKAMKASQDMSDGIKRIGSAEVAALNEDTLPEGWKQLEKYLDTADTRLEKRLGKSRSKITKQDLIEFLEEQGYDTEGTKNDLWKNALMAIDDEAVNELYDAGGAAGEFLQNRLPFRSAGTMRDATHFYIGNKGRTGRLDAEYSDRLGIGRSNTPMADNTVSWGSSAGGSYSKGGFGTNPNWATGESGVSTTAHERFHAWQDINKFDWDERVGDAIDELRSELKKYYHNEDEIKKYWGNSKTNYYMNEEEQEARMLQSYLDNEGFTNTYRKSLDKGTEWGDEIKPAFDKFYKKLRALSKAGVALPAIAVLFGLSANSEENKEKTY